MVARRRFQGGFTLLEALVALFVVAMALVPLLGLHVGTVDRVTDNDDLLRATLLARETLAETLLAEPFPELGIDSGEFESSDGFRWEVEVLGSPIPELDEFVREVRVRVYWDEEARDVALLVTHVRGPFP